MPRQVITNKSGSHRYQCMHVADKCSVWPQVTRVKCQSLHVSSHSTLHLFMLHNSLLPTPNHGCRTGWNSALNNECHGGQCSMSSLVKLHFTLCRQQYPKLQTQWTTNTISSLQRYTALSFKCSSIMASEINCLLCNLQLAN